jgi:ADP-ribosylation factor-binding protein GGA
MRPAHLHPYAPPPSTDIFYAYSSPQNLKSAEELENEDREAQSAKLQELIRRGTPRDLAAAQELVKSLAGANPDAKPDYRSQALTELNKLEQKVILLHEMLDNVDTERGESFAKGDVYDVWIYPVNHSMSRLIVPHSKLLRSYSIPDRGYRNGSQTQNRTIPSHLVCSYFCFAKHLSSLSPSDTYLQTNDQINSVLSRYDAFKRGETPPASIPAELLPGQNDPLSLIDFDDATPQPGSGSGVGSSGNPADDLAGLFESATSLTSVPVTQPPLSSGLGTSPLLPNVTNKQTSAISPQFSSPLPATSAPSSRPQSQFGQIKLPSTPPLQNQSQASGRVGPPGVISPLAPARASLSSNVAATSIPQQPLVPQATSVPPISQVSTPQGKDPFADLAGLF